MLTVRQATIVDLNDVAHLFDAYRQFYGKPTDFEGGLTFLRARFEHEQSIVLIAIEDDQKIGFVQLFPSFSSLRLSQIFILNDLFVTPTVRRTGAGRALIDGACQYARSRGAVGLSLSTALTNTTAQALYERAGWVRDTEFYSYNIALPIR